MKRPVAVLFAAAAFSFVLNTHAIAGGHNPPLPEGTYVPGHYVPTHFTPSHLVKARIKKDGTTKDAYIAPPVLHLGHFVEPHVVKRHK